MFRRAAEADRPAAGATHRTCGSATENPTRPRVQRRLCGSPIPGPCLRPVARPCGRCPRLARSIPLAAAQAA